MILLLAMILSMLVIYCYDYLALRYQKRYGNEPLYIALAIAITGLILQLVFKLT